MRKLLSCSMVMAFLCLAGPQDATAQGWGGFWNYMNKLSGPRTTGPGLHVFTAGGEREAPQLLATPQSFLDDPGFPFRTRLGVGVQRTFASDDAIDPDGSSITVVTAKLAVERDLIPKLAIGVEGALNWFFGDVDTFQHASGRAYAQAVIPLSDRVDLTPGVAAYIWPAFDATDFQPLVVDVDRTGTEITWGLFVGIDWHVWN